MERKRYSTARSTPVVILDDPFPDPPGLQDLLDDGTLVEPTRPPDNSTRIAEDEDPMADADLPEDVVEEMNRKKAAAAAQPAQLSVGDSFSSEFNSFMLLTLHGLWRVSLPK